MTESQYDQYANLHTFARDWRHYTQTSQPLDESTFRKDMQTNKYIRLDYFNDKTGRPVLIYLLARDSRYSNSSQDLKRLLAKIKEPSDVILVSRDELKTYSLKTINSFKHLRVKTYRHSTFSLIAPNGPLCYPHRILSRPEADELLNNDLCCYLTNLPKLLQDDVQCIWIGAEVGDIVEVTMKSDIAGECIRYHVVIPSSGKVVSFRDNKPIEKKETKMPAAKPAKGKATKGKPVKEDVAKEIEEEEEEENEELADLRNNAYNTDESDAEEDTAAGDNTAAEETEQEDAE